MPIGQGFCEAYYPKRAFSVTPTAASPARNNTSPPNAFQRYRLVWIKSPEKPLKFRNAGYFWGIAPGTPSEVVRERVGGVDRLLGLAEEALAKSGAERIVQSHGRELFDAQGLERIRDFQRALKKQFHRELLSLDPEGSY